MPEKRVRRRYFWLSFSVSFLALSVIAAGMVLSLNPIQQPKKQDPLQNVYIPSQNDSITALLIGTESADGPAGTFLLIRFNPEAGQIPVTAFPPQTLIRNGEKQMTLYDVYRHGGAVTAKNALAQTFEISVDRYARMTPDAFIAAADILGSMEYDLPCDLHYTDEKMSIRLAKGKQLISGVQIADILRYPVFDGGQLTRAEVAGDLTAELINQKIDLVFSPFLDNIFKKIVNLADTDITYVDYESHRKAAEFMANLSFSPANSLPLSGTFPENEEGYLLDEETVQLIQFLYK